MIDTVVRFDVRARDVGPPQQLALIAESRPTSLPRGEDGASLWDFASASQLGRLNQRGGRTKLRSVARRRHLRCPYVGTHWEPCPTDSCRGPDAKSRQMGPQLPILPTHLASAPSVPLSRPGDARGKGRADVQK
jgi:hypothetical protein